MADTDPKDAPQSRRKQADEMPGAINAQIIDHVGVTLEAFLGETRMTVGELTALCQGSVVALDAPLSQAVELRLNGVAVARGELVAAGDKFAVRLVDVSK